MIQFIVKRGLLGVVFLVFINLKAQVQHVATTIPPGNLTINQMFSGIYINTSVSSVNVKVKLDLFVSGEKVLSAWSKDFMINSMQTLNLLPYTLESTLAPYKVDFCKSSLQKYVYGAYNNKIPLNNYEYCISIWNAIELIEISPQSCSFSDNTFQNCPHPISPFSGSVELSKPVFSWTPNVNFNLEEDCYMFRMVKLFQNQNENTALMNNLPLVEETNIKNTTYFLPLEIELDSCSKYAWQVEYVQQCSNNRNKNISVCGSEVATFSLPCKKEEKEKEEKASYVYHPLKKTLQQGLFIVKDDTLRMQLINYYNTVDSVSVMAFTENNEPVDIKDAVKEMFMINKGFKHGQNLLKMPLSSTQIKKRKNYIIKIKTIEGTINQLRFQRQ